MNLGRIVILLSLAVVTSCSSPPKKRERSQLKYSPGQLRLMEVDEMNDLLTSRLRQFKQSRDYRVIDEALELALSRPDADNILERELLIIQNSFSSFEEWQKSVNRVVDKAGVMLTEKTCSVQDEASYTIVLENLMSEFRAEFNKTEVNTEFELGIIEKIAAMDLKVSEAAFREAKLNAMSTLISPSDIARKLLVEINALPNRK